MTLFQRLRSWWLRRRPLSEPDRARLNFLGSGYKVSNGDLDTLDVREILPKLHLMKGEGTRWVVVVMPTRERHEHWWVHRLMLSFGPPVSRVDLQDGRMAFLTWGVPTR